MRTQLEALIKEVSKKNLKIGELLQLKAKESIHLHSQLQQAFKKHSGIEAQKVLVKANMELVNHLHHVERELGSTRIEMKRLCHEAQRLTTILRKKSK